jgi:hypothetical protein
MGKKFGYDEHRSLDLDRKNGSTAGKNEEK